MRFLPFVALYAGVLVSTTLVLPVPSEYEWAPVKIVDASRFPRCIQILPDPGTGWIRLEGFVDFGERSIPAEVPGAYEVGSPYGEIHWVPSRGDSFDLAGHHTLILRLPASGSDTVVGRAYPPRYENIFEALLARPMTATALRVECPRSGGGR